MLINVSVLLNHCPLVCPEQPANLFHRGIAGGEHLPTAADIVAVLQASNIPIHLLGLIRVGKIMSFPTKKIAVDPNGEPAFFFFWSYRTPFECRELPFYGVLRSFARWFDGERRYRLRRRSFRRIRLDTPSHQIHSSNTAIGSAWGYSFRLRNRTNALCSR